MTNALIRDESLVGFDRKNRPIRLAEKPRKPFGGKGRKNVSGLLRVSLIAKAAGYSLGNPTQVLREAGFEILKNKTGQPCVRVKDNDAAYDLLEETALKMLAEAGEQFRAATNPTPGAAIEPFANPSPVTEEEKKLLNLAASSAPSVDYDALKDQEAEVAVRGILAQFEDEALVDELRGRGWTVTCTKSI